MAPTVATRGGATGRFTDSNSAMIEALKARLRMPVARLLVLLARLSRAQAGLVLVYHRLGDPHEPREGRLDPAMGTAQFEAQLDHLRKTYDVVPARQLLTAVKRRRRGRRLPVAITFDDDLPSHVRVAMPVLRRLGLPATFFLCGASLHQPFAFWWQRLQSAMDAGKLGGGSLAGLLGREPATAEPIDVHQASAAITAMSPDRREQVAESLGDLIGGDPPDAGLRAESIRTLARAGFEIGFHTRDHHALPALDDDRLARAFDDGRSELAGLATTEIRSVAYPFGMADARVARAARAAGFQFGFTGAPEPAEPDTDPLLIGRFDPPYESIAVFAIRVARLLRRTSSS